MPYLQKSIRSLVAVGTLLTLALAGTAAGAQATAIPSSGDGLSQSLDPQDTIFQVQQPPPGRGANRPGRPAPPPGPGQGAGPQFVSTCDFSHAKADDPIVYPRVAFVSHLHDFFGNATTNADSTPSTLIAAGSTTCADPQDTAAYWVPALLNNNQLVAPLRMRVYYRLARENPATLKPLPAGLVMIAGDSHATVAQSTSIVSYGCGDGPGSARQSTPPVCSSGPTLQAQITFPNCWDGVNLDSANHKSHMAYAASGVCPADHPVEMPQITETVIYPRFTAGTLTLSSGSMYSLHADFMNGWVQSALNNLVQRCLVDRNRCGPGPGYV